MVDCRSAEKNKNKSFYHVKGFLSHCNSSNDMFHVVARFIIHDILLYMERKNDDRHKIQFPKMSLLFVLMRNQKNFSLDILVGNRPMLKN